MPTPRSQSPRTPATDERRFARDPVADDPRLMPAAGGPPPEGPGPDWRDDVVTASGLNVIAGVWLIIAPFVLGYSNGDPYWNDIVFGAIVAVLALVRVSGAYRASELSWINAAIGIWLIGSAFWLDSTATAGWNDVILGAIVLILAALSAGASDAARGVAAEPRPRWRR
ncbi:MAG TPA: SPW repeat protein [Baekduia sp.]|nr:SPW repeat protein [Baekduia sp.]